MSQITIQNLYFTYDGDHTPVFEDLNLQLDTAPPAGGGAGGEGDGLAAAAVSPLAQAGGRPLPAGAGHPAGGGAP